MNNTKRDGRGWSLDNMDALEWLSSLRHGEADAIIMDPPFTAAGGSTNGRASLADDQFWIHWFSDVWERAEAALKPSGCGFIFCDYRMIQAMNTAISGGFRAKRSERWKVGQALVWDRQGMGMGSPFRASFEMIAFVRGPDWKQDVDLIPKNVPNVLRHQFHYGSHPHHNAEKPVDLIDRLVGFCTRRGELIIDPFSGSGSVGVSAIRNGRRYYGCEALPEYFTTMAERIADEDCASVVLFDHAAPTVRA